MQTHIKNIPEGSDLQLYQKGAPIQLFSCEICEICKNTYLKNICEQLLLSNAILMWPSLQYFVLIIHKVFNVLLKIPSEEPQASPDVENVKYVFLFLEMYFLLSRWHHHFGEFEKV